MKPIPFLLRLFDMALACLAFSYGIIAPPSPGQKTVGIELEGDGCLPTPETHPEHFK